MNIAVDSVVLSFGAMTLFVVGVSIGYVVSAELNARRFRAKHRLIRRPTKRPATRGGYPAGEKTPDQLKPPPSGASVGAHR